PKCAAAHVGAIEVKLENLVLCQARFKPHGEKRFLDFALNRSLVVEEQVLRKLLGNGRAALYDTAGARIGHQCSLRAWKIDAEVFVKAPILCREHVLDQMIRKLVERYCVIMFDAARADLVPVPVKESHGQL